MPLTTERPAVTVTQPPTEQNAPPVSAPADLLRAIRSDCRDEPQRYLDQTRVPFGGE
jgi:hypothetical protein